MTTIFVIGSIFALVVIIGVMFTLDALDRASDDVREDGGFS